MESECLAGWVTEWGRAKAAGRAPVVSPEYREEVARAPEGGSAW